MTLSIRAQYGPTSLEHLAGRNGEGRAEIYSFLKMKTAANAALAAVKFQKQMAAGKKEKEAAAATAGA